MYYDLSDLTVLVVEQHAHMSELMKRVLRELGVRNVRDTKDPEKAYQMFIGTPADLILTDWSPTLDGIDFLYRVRNDELSPNPFVPVIVVTAHAELKHVVTARDKGMTEFLAKPISAKLIYTRIRSIIEAKRPFVRTASFFGPDRRRRRISIDGPDRRRHENMSGTERRDDRVSPPPSEQRQGNPGYQTPERRAVPR